MISAKDFIRWCSLESVSFVSFVVVDIDSDFDFKSFFGAKPTRVVPNGLCVALYSYLRMVPYKQINNTRLQLEPDAYIARSGYYISLYVLE